MSRQIQTTESLVTVLHRLRHEASEGRARAAVSTDDQQRKQLTSEAAASEAVATKLEQQLREAGHRL